MSHINFENFVWFSFGKKIIEFCWMCCRQPVETEMLHSNKSRINKFNPRYSGRIFN